MFKTNTPQSPHTSDESNALTSGVIRRKQSAVCVDQLISCAGEEPEPADYAP